MSVASLCLTISSDRSWPWRPKLRRRRLGERVASVFEASRGTYGCRRVAAALNRQGTACSVGMVADLMHELGLKARQPRAYKLTTIDGGQAWRRPDLIEQDFTAGSPGERLLGDITYMRTGQGWLYLATVIDSGTRTVIGWQLADRMRASPVLDALEMAHLHWHQHTTCPGFCDGLPSQAPAGSPTGPGLCRTGRPPLAGNEPGWLDVGPPQRSDPPRCPSPGGSLRRAEVRCAWPARAR